MKLLFDENLSPRLVRALEDLYPGSAHLRDIGLEGAADRRVWRAAAEGAYLLISKDTDFYQRSLVHGAPPKVIWLRIGNGSTAWRVQQVALSDELVVVSVTGNLEVLLFQRDGTLVSAFGGRGNGPGEFLSIRDMVVRGDSIYVLDSLARRVTLFVGGSYSRSWSFREVGGNARALGVTMPEGRVTVAVEADDFVSPYPAHSGPYFYRPPIAVISIDPVADGEWVVLLSEVVGPESMVVPYPEAGPTGYARVQPAFADLVSVVSTESELLSLEHRPGQVLRWRWDGTSDTLRRPGNGPAWVSDAELMLWDAALDEFAMRMQGSRDPERTREMHRAGIDRWGGADSSPQSWMP